MRGAPMIAVAAIADGLDGPLVLLAVSLDCAPAGTGDPAGATKPAAPAVAALLSRENHFSMSASLLLSQIYSLVVVRLDLQRERTLAVDGPPLHPLHVQR